MQSKEILNENLKRAYECTVPAADVEQAIEQELKKVGGKAKIAGFRPGKIPVKILEQRYGKSVQADVVRHMVTNAVLEVVRDNKLRPAVQPNVKDEDYEKGKDLTFSFDFEILPDLPEIDYGKISVERETYDIQDGDIDDALTRLAERSPEPKDLEEGTKAKEGHLMTMNFAGRVNGELFDGGSAKEYPIEIGSGQLIAGFEDQLIGLKAGDSKTIEVTFPENYFNKELADQPAEFEVEVIKVSEMVTPDIDEEFAKKRNFADLRALKEAVRDQLKKEFDNMVRTNMKKRLFDQLEDMVDFPVPEVMFEAEFNSIWDKLQRAKDEDTPLSEDLRGKSDDELKEEYTGIANRRVRLGILLADIGHKEKLEVSRDELSRALLAYASNFPGQEQRVVEFYKTNPERLEEFHGPILEDKAVDWVFDKINYEDAPTTIKELTEKAESEDEGELEKPKAKKKPAAKKKATKSKAKKEGDE